MGNLLTFYLLHEEVLNQSESESESRSVVSDSLWPHELYSTWNSPGQNTRVGSLSLLQGIFPVQGLNSLLFKAVATYITFIWFCLHYAFSDELQGSIYH